MLNIHLSKKQVKAKVQYSGGFLGMLAELDAKAQPALLSGLPTCLVSGTVDKSVRGRGHSTCIHRDVMVMGCTCINVDTVLKWNLQKEMVCD